MMPLTRKYLSADFPPAPRHWRGVPSLGTLSILSVVVACLAIAQTTIPTIDFRVVGDTVVSYQFDAVPKWGGGALTGFSGNASLSPVVRVVDANGRVTAEIEVRIPGATRVLIRQAAHGTGGATAICGSASDQAGHTAGFLVLASAGGKIQQIVRTEPYVAAGVAVAPDGTIWTSGVEYDRAHAKLSKTTKGVIRQFDASGKPLAEFVAQSSLQANDLMLGISEMAASSARVGWYQSRSTAGYFEVSQGRVERYPAINLQGDHRAAISGLTITESGRVVVTKSVSGSDPELYTLDRRVPSWIKVAGPIGGSPAVTNWLVGGDSDTLVFKTTEQSQRLRRFDIGTK